MSHALLDVDEGGERTVVRWPEPEAGHASAWGALALFAILVAAVGGALATASAFSLAEDPRGGTITAVLTIASAFSTAVAVLGAVLAGLLTRAMRRRAPGRVVLDEGGLQWGRRRLPWRDVRDVMRTRRVLEGRPASTLVVVDASGAEVWLGLDLPDEPATELHVLVRGAWDRWSASQGGIPGSPHLRIVQGGRTDAS